MSWLDKVQEAHDTSPSWLMSVLEHERFIQLDRVDGWRIVTNEEIEFRDPDLENVCNKFSSHYRLR